MSLLIKKYSVNTENCCKWKKCITKGKTEVRTKQTTFFILPLHCHFEEETIYLDVHVASLNKRKQTQILNFLNCQKETS